MARYTFICEHFDYDIFRGEENGVASKHTTEFRADDLTTMLENFESFLRGAGFHFDGVIDVVKPEEEMWSEEEIEIFSEPYESAINIEDDINNEQKSEWDFSNIPNNNWLFGEMKPQSQEENGIFISDSDVTLDLNMGAGQPAMSLYSEDFIGEHCAICKLPKSVMIAERCYDKLCPKTSFLSDYDYKIASEK